MSIAIRDLEYLLAVDRHGSITRAAEACSVSQPTLSTQIAKLERDLGVAVFERDGRTLKLTDAGRAVLARAQTIVAAVDDLVATAQAHRDPLAGTLRLGVIPTLAPYLLPHLLPAMREAMPAIALAVVEQQTALLLGRLRDGTLDAAMIATPTNDDRLDELALFDEPLHVALPANHLLAAHASIAAREIDVATLLLLAEGHCLRDQGLALCDEASLANAVPSDLSATSLDTVLNLVEAGFGITLVPALALQSPRLRGSALTTRPFSDGASRTVRLVYRRSSARLTLLRRLAAITRTTAGESVRG